MTTRTVRAYEHQCEKCGHVWRSFLKDPKRCQASNCHSPYWKTKADPSLGGRLGSAARVAALRVKKQVIDKSTKGDKS